MTHFMFSYKSGLTVFVPQSEVFNEVYYEVGDALAPNGIPIAQEIDGWSELCHVGEQYVTDSFTVECVR